ncbi:MAG: hypothetical protein ACYDBB_08890 [Armatimonadota bacterium]
MRYYFLLLLLVLSSIGFCAEPHPWTVEAVLQNVSPLKRDMTGRWPMITWEAFVLENDRNSFQEARVLPMEIYRELAKRGLAPTVRMDEKYLPMAKAIQQAGMKVIFMEGAGGNGPGAEAPDSLHKLPADYIIPKGSKHYPCPLLLQGWNNRAAKVRGILQKFRDAEVTVDGAWLDWEEEPWWVEDRWEQARKCSRCRELFPPGVLDDWPTYRSFIAVLKQHLYSTYLAAPILEVFPKCVVTNWGVVYSSTERPTQHYWGRFLLPPLDAGFFNATNPVAYGNDNYYSLHWKKAWAKPEQTPLDIAHMDRLYTYHMLAQVSGDQANAQHCAPDRLCIPWVARYCPDDEDKNVPILSRERYREILRHLWLRGADSMQLFNAHRQEHPEIALEEIQDAVAIYDEVLAFHEFLDRGKPVEFGVPGVEDDGAVWSGLLLENRLLVRTFTPGKKEVKLTLAPWKELPAVEVTASPAGEYYLLEKGEGKVRMERVKNQ